MTDATNARVGITGAVRVAPLGTTLPTDAVSALDAAFDDLGYLSEDGVTLGFDDSVQNVFAWQNATLIRSITSQSITSLSFSMIEIKGVTLEFFHRGSTMTEVAADNFRLDIKPPVAAPRIVVVDVIDGLNSIRYSFGNAEVVSRGEVPINNSNLLMLPVTLNFYPDSNGNLSQAFSNDVDWSTA